MWVAMNPRIRQLMEKELQDLVLLNGVSDTPQDQQALNARFLERIQQLFPHIQGLRDFLDALKWVETPEERPVEVIIRA